MRLTIKGQHYTVKISKDINKQTGGTGYIFGAINTSKRTILIDATQTSECAYETLGHEIIHAGLGHSGLRNMLTDSKEEAICDALSDIGCHYVDKDKFTAWFHRNTSKD